MNKALCCTPELQPITLRLGWLNTNTQLTQKVDNPPSSNALLLSVGLYTSVYKFGACLPVKQGHAICFSNITIEYLLILVVEKKIKIKSNGFDQHIIVT